jgi:Fe-S-cluster containining protein
MNAGIVSYVDSLINSNPHIDPRDLMKEVGANIEFYREQAAKHISKSMDHRLGVVEGFHRSIDEDISNHNAVTSGLVKCKKGCAHCCKIQVEVALCEAQYLLHHCKENGIEIDVDYLKNQAALKLEDFAISKFRSCVFLGNDNACKVYDARPTACRRYMVTSDPKHCEYTDGVKQVISMIIMDVDMKCFGLMAADSDNGNMAEMLLKAIELDKSKKL